MRIIVWLVGGRRTDVVGWSGDLREMGGRHEGRNRMREVFGSAQQFFRCYDMARNEMIRRGHLLRRKDHHRLCL